MSDTCPTCGSDDPAHLPPAGDDPDVRVACLDPWHDEGTGLLPAEGYGHAEAMRDAWTLCEDGDCRACGFNDETGVGKFEQVCKPAFNAAITRLAAYIERLEAEKAEIRREEADTRAAHDYCAEVKADRDRYKAEAERWERVAQERGRVLRLVHEAVRDPSLTAISMCVAVGILVKSWAEKEVENASE